MAGLGGAPAQSIQAGLSAQPLVTEATPLSPTVLDAFRSGFLTADDIIERIGPGAKAKKKAELTLATEATSPEAIAARQAALAAQTAQAQLQQAQAAAASPLIQPQADLQAAEIAAKQRLLPAQTDLTAQQLEMNSKYMYPKAAYELATEKLKPVNPVKRVDPSTGAEFTQMLNAAGEDVTPGSPAHATYSRIAQSAFANIDPGTAQVAPRVTAPQATTIIQPAQPLPAPGSPITGTAGGAARAALVTANPNVPGSVVAGLPDVTAQAIAAKPVIEPQVAAATDSSGYVPGKGLQTGMRSIKDRALVPAEGVEKLALASQAKSTADRLNQAYNDLINSDPIFTGLINGTVTKAIAGKRWNARLAAFEREATAILAPVAKGTYNETGVLSDKDVERYKNVLPDLRDTPTVGNEKMRRLIDEVNSAYTNKLSLWKQAGYDITGFTGGTATPATPAASPQGKVVNIPGLGIGTFDSSTGLFTRTQ